MVEYILGEEIVENAPLQSAAAAQNDRPIQKARGGGTPTAIGIDENTLGMVNKIPGTHLLTR